MSEPRPSVDSEGNRPSKRQRLEDDDGGESRESTSVALPLVSKKQQKKEYKVKKKGQPWLPGNGAAALDFSKHPTAHVALRIMYHGHTHDGLAKQDNSKNTIEWYLFDAMEQVRLIPPADPPGAQPSCYSRCGRTDKGVSAFGNVVALKCRGAKKGMEPLNYARLINKRLPLTIRVVGECVVGWEKPASEENAKEAEEVVVAPAKFDARFSCVSRTYRYYFVTHDYPQLAAMERAATMLIGEHDFRNFCYMDVVNRSNFVREMQVCRRVPVEGPLAGAVSYMEIRGNAFLYHQIRCTMAVLFMIGKGEEKPEVVQQLLDLKQVPAKPCYEMASDAPLVLWDCSFDNVEWRMDEEDRCRWIHESHNYVCANLVSAAVGAEMEKETRELLKADRAARGQPVDAPLRIPVQNGNLRAHLPHVPLLDIAARGVNATFEQKVASLGDTKKAKREENIAKGSKNKPLSPSHPLGA